jgi:hypothetical protein
MTDPEENPPSFIARLAMVATIGIVVLQLGFVFEVVGGMKRVGRRLPESWLNLILLPAVSFLAVACLYYIFKGKPTDTDKVIAHRLLICWLSSVLGGAGYCFGLA